MNVKELYIAIIGDIIDSRKIIDRNEVQVKLLDVLKLVNTEYKNSVASNFMISMGDEFQGLLRVDSNFTEIINIIELKMFPTKIRFGIGVGDVDININKLRSVENTGTAYYMARESMDELAKNKNKHKNYLGNVYMKINNGEKENDNVINAIFSLVSVIKKQWNSNRNEIILNYIQCNENQVETAKKMGIDQSWVSKLLNSSNYYLVKNSYKTIDQFLKKEINTNGIL